MKKELSFKTDSYQPEERARQEWDTRLGTAIKTRDSWRLGFFIVLGIVGVQGVSLAWVSSQKEIRVYTREVDARTGHVTGVVRADGTYTPSQATKAATVKDFIEDICDKGTDPVMIHKAWQAAYAHASQRGGQELTAKAIENPPDANVGTDIHQCHVGNVIAQTENSFQARWTNEKIIGGGKPNLVSYWTGVFTIVHFDPPNEDALMANPEGIYVDNFNYGQDR